MGEDALPRDQPHAVPTAGSLSIPGALRRCRQLHVLLQAKPSHPQNLLQAVTPSPTALTHKKSPGRAEHREGVQAANQNPTWFCPVVHIQADRLFSISPFQDGSFHLPFISSSRKKTSHGRKSTSCKGAGYLLSQKDLTAVFAQGSCRCCEAKF